MVFSSKLIDGQITLGTGVQAREGSDFRFKGDSERICPLSVNVGSSVFFALSWQIEERVGKQRLKPSCHELAVVCTQGSHFKRMPLI